MRDVNNKMTDYNKKDNSMEILKINHMDKPKMEKILNLLYMVNFKTFIKKLLQIIKP